MDDATERRQRAWAALHDTALQARIAEALASFAPTGAPPLAVIAGANWVNAAHRLGVLAGSFNPPTLAHVALARSALQQARLDAVLWAISHVTVDKERVTRAPLASRLAILTTLAEHFPYTAVGILSAGLYADQARDLRASLPQITDLVFIMGFDKIVQIFDPQYYTDFAAALDELFGQARILVAPRDGEGEHDLAALLATPPNRPYADRVQFLPLDPALQALSSTELRARIARGDPIADGAPPEALALVDAGAYQ